MEKRTIEERVAALETEVAHLKMAYVQKALTSKTQIEPRWRKIVGIFKDDSDFEEEVRLGREWRQSQQMTDEEDQA